MSVFGELKRRNVVRVGAAYVAAVWLTIQVADVILPTFEAPPWVMKALIFALALGFPFAIALAWFYELTPEGIKSASEVKDGQPVAFTGRKLDFAIIGLLVLAVGFLLIRDIVLDPDSERSVAASRDASIAVLPFVNASSDPEQDYFSDGIAEDVLNLLAQVPEFRVISRASSFKYRNTDIDVATVADQLNVSHLLMGSVRTVGDEVRIATQLVDARTDSTVWADTYDRVLDDIFAVQDDIAASVLGELQVTLLGTAPKSREINPEAYRLFLQAKHILDGRTPLELYPVAAEYLRQALELEPEHPRALLEQARLYNQERNRGLRPREEAMALVRQRIAEVLAIDPNYGAAYGWLSYLARRFDGDVPAIARYEQRAVELLNPTNTEMLGNFASLELLAPIEDAIAVAEYAVEHDPLCDYCVDGLGRLYGHAGRFEEAEEQFEAALALNLDDPVYDEYGDMLLIKGDAEAALDVYSRQNDAVDRARGRALGYFALGRQRDSEMALDELRELSQGDDNAYGIASVYAYWGEADAAFEWLERVLDGDRPPAKLNIAIDPLFVKLHADPRWEPLLTKVGTAPAQIAALNFRVTLPK